MHFFQESAWFNKKTILFKFLFDNLYTVNNLESQDYSNRFETYHFDKQKIVCFKNNLYFEMHDNVIVLTSLRLNFRS